MIRLSRRICSWLDAPTGPGGRCLLLVRLGRLGRLCSFSPFVTTTPLRFLWGFGSLGQRTLLDVLWLLKRIYLERNLRTGLDVLGADKRLFGRLGRDRVSPASSKSQEQVSSPLRSRQRRDDRRSPEINPSFFVFLQGEAPIVQARISVSGYPQGPSPVELPDRGPQAHVALPPPPPPRGHLRG